ncbi:ComEA family DNA-binding protein, partial [candidate division KSB1 bacterium]
VSVQKLVFEESADKYKVKYVQLDNQFASLEKQDSLVIQTEKGKQTLININTASLQELIKLPGIGPKLSERIIQYRKDKGKFKTKRELIKIKGIGEKKIEKILPLICIEN